MHCSGRAAYQASARLTPLAPEKPCAPAAPPVPDIQPGPSRLDVGIPQGVVTQRMQTCKRAIANNSLLAGNRGVHLEGCRSQSCRLDPCRYPTRNLIATQQMGCHSVTQ